MKIAEEGGTVHTYALLYYTDPEDTRAAAELLQELYDARVLGPHVVGLIFSSPQIAEHHRKFLGVIDFDGR